MSSWATKNKTNKKKKTFKRALAWSRGQRAGALPPPSVSTCARHWTLELIFKDVWSVDRVDILGSLHPPLNSTREF